MVAAEKSGVETAGRQVFDELLQERGLQPGAYALFFVVGEGTFFELPQSKEVPVHGAPGRREGIGWRYC